VLNKVDPDEAAQKTTFEVPTNITVKSELGDDAKRFE